MSIYFFKKKSTAFLMMFKIMDYDRFKRECKNAKNRQILQLEHDWFS